MDHHRISIIITASAILIKWCYLFILLVTGISTEPTLFHVGCRPTLHVGIHHLYLTLSQNGPPNSYIWPHLVRKARPALTSNLILSERPSTHIWPCVNTSCQNGSALTSDLILSERHNTHIWPCVNTLRQNGSALTSDLILSERLYTYIRPCVNTSHRKGMHSHPTVLSEWPPFPYWATW